MDDYETNEFKLTGKRNDVSSTFPIYKNGKLMKSFWADYKKCCGGKHYREQNTF